MGNAKWTAASFGYMTAFAYVISLFVYQLGDLFATGKFTVWSAVAIVLLAGILFLIFRKNKYTKSSLKK